MSSPTDTEFHKVTLGVSSCLLGENVRYDGSNKENHYLLNTLAQYVNFHSFCPEFAIGLGVPREPIQLIKRAEKIYCVGTKTPTLDVTQKLKSVANQQLSWHKQISGYILKSKSPSCAIENLNIFHEDGKTVSEENGTGLYTHQLMKSFPALPVIEEKALENIELRENFLQRVYIYARWQALITRQYTLSDLQTFHAQHKYIYMSHDQLKLKALGSLISADSTQLEDLAQRYIVMAMALLKIPASKESHANALSHIQGYLKTHLTTEQKQELAQTISLYRQGEMPLSAPISLLQEHFKAFPNKYINQSYYLFPPKNYIPT